MLSVLQPVSLVKKWKSCAPPWPLRPLLSNQCPQEKGRRCVLSCDKLPGLGSALTTSCCHWETFWVTDKFILGGDADLILWEIKLDGKLGDRFCIL